MESSIIKSPPIGLSTRGVRRSPAGAFGLFPDELEAYGGGPALFSALHRPWTWMDGKPRIGRAVSARLAELDREVPRVVARRASEDGSHKLLLALGSDWAEVVHMPRSLGTDRVTLCISSQIGCAMGCTFCATAKMGLRRQLSAGQMVSQVLCAMHELGPRHPSALTLVFMGMGEPLHNLGEVSRAVALFCSPAGLGLSPRRITVSTSGLVPAIEALARIAPRPLLAVSLNATTDALRSELMPVNRRYPLTRLRDVLASYPVRPRERITIEYVLLKGVNDSEQDAARLADFCRDFPHNINLIPWNRHPDSGFEAPTESDLERFVELLLGHRPGLVTVRRSRGQDIDAACGQLAVSPGEPTTVATRSSR